MGAKMESAIIHMITGRTAYQSGQALVCHDSIALYTITASFEPLTCPYFFIVEVTLEIYCLLHRSILWRDCELTVLGMLRIVHELSSPNSLPTSKQVGRPKSLSQRAKSIWQKETSPTAPHNGQCNAMKRTTRGYFRPEEGFRFL